MELDSYVIMIVQMTDNTIRIFGKIKQRMHFFVFLQKYMICYNKHINALGSYSIFIGF